MQYGGVGDANGHQTKRLLIWGLPTRLTSWAALEPTEPAVRHEYRDRGSRGDGSSAGFGAGLGVADGTWWGERHHEWDCVRWAKWFSRAGDDPVIDRRAFLAVTPAARSAS